MAQQNLDKASFHRMDKSTKADWDLISRHLDKERNGLAGRILDHLKLLDGECGFAVSRLEHSLQTATYALNAGKDEEYVVCALLHDLGDTLGAYNHADIAAAVLKPFVSEKNHWIVAHHAIFQGYYFFQHIGVDRDMREQYREHPYFDACAEFCKFDQAAFDPNFRSIPLSEFEPMVQRVFAQPKSSIYIAE
jgi:predicted HD phosphohydrolase